MGRGGSEEMVPVPVVAMVCLQLVSAGTALLNRKAFLNGVDPMVFIVYRQAIAASVTFPISYFTRKQPSRCPSTMGIKSFAMIFTTAFMGITLSQYLYNKGLYMTSSSIATASSNLAPAITFIFALIFGLEQVKIRRLSSMAKIVGTSISVGGALCIALLRGPPIFNSSSQLLLPPSSSSTNFTTMMLHLFSSEDPTWLWGCLCLLASMLLWSSWLILQVPITKDYPDPLSLSAWLSFLAMFQAAAIALFTVEDPRAWIISSPLELTSLYFSGVVGSGVTVFVQAWCITRRGPFFTSVFAPLATVVTTVLECLISHETLYLGSLLGAVGVIIGLYIVLWGKAREVKGDNSVHNTEEHQVQTTQAHMPWENDIEQPLLTTTNNDTKEKVETTSA